MPAVSEPRPIRVVLVGAGHTHVGVLDRWAKAPPAGTTLTVVVDRPEAVYSGMVPGLVAGDYRLDETAIPVLPLAARARAKVVLERAVRIDPDAKTVVTASGVVVD